MAGPYILDRVRETTTTTGTGTLTLAGAVTGFQSFAAVGNGNTCYYCVTDGTNWEVGLGTYTSSGTTLARTTVLASSNSNAAVSFAAGTKQVFVTSPAAWFGGPLTAGSVLFAGTGGLLSQDNSNFYFDDALNLLKAPIVDKGGQVYDVRAYGAAWDGSTDDTTAVQAAVAAALAHTDCGVVYLPPGRGTFGTITIQPADTNHRIVIRGAGHVATLVIAKSGIADALFKIVSPDGSSTVGGYEISGFRATMAGQSQPCLSIDRVSACKFTDLYFIGGTYGIYCTNTGGSLFQDIYLDGPTTCGLYVNGENGGENDYVRVYVNCASGTLTDGIRVQRTSATDFGGHYFLSCKVVETGTGTVTNGFRFDSNTGFTFTGVTMVDCVADSVSTTGLVLTNATDCRITNSWFNSEGYAVQMDGCRKIQVTGCDVTGITGGFDFVGTTNACLGIGLTGNRVPSGIAYNIPGTNPPQALSLAGNNTQNATSLSNSNTALALCTTTASPADTDFHTLLGTRVLTRSDQGAYQCFVLQDGATGYRSYFRVNAGAGLQILNNSFVEMCLLAGEWSDSSTTYDGIRFTATDTASKKDSNLINLRVSSVSKFRVDKQGTVFGNSFVGSAFKTWFLQQDPGQPTAAEPPNASRVLKNGVSATALTVNGNAATNSSQAVTDSTGQYIEYSSATTAGTSKAGWEFPSAAPTVPIFSYQANGIATFVLKTYTTITAQRLWVGWFSADPTGADLTNAIHGMGFRVSTGTVGSIAVNTGGTYTSAPTVTISTSGATAAATATATYAAGAVTAITVTSPGNNYPVSGAGGSGGTLTLTTSGGAISSAVVLAGGSGYPVSQAIRLRVVKDGSLGEVTITTSAGGALAGAVTISTAGSGYTNGTATTADIPWITFSGGGQTVAATATASLGSRWDCITGNGTTMTCTPGDNAGSNAAVTADTRYVLRVDANSGSDVKFYVNNVLVNTVTTTLPGSATSLMGVCELRTLVGAARALRISSLRMEHE